MKRPVEVLLVVVGCALVFGRFLHSTSHSSTEAIPPTVSLYTCEHHYTHPEAERLFIASGVQNLRQAIALEPANPVGYYHLSRQLHDMGRYHESIEAASRAIELRPGFASAWNGRAYSRALLDDPEQWENGLIDIRTALGLEGKESTYYDTRGYLLYRMGRWQEALVDLDRAVNEQPTPEHLKHRAECLEALGRPEEARRDRERVSTL